MNAHGEGYVKGFLDAGSIPAGSTKNRLGKFVLIEPFLFPKTFRWWTIPQHPQQIGVGDSGIEGSPGKSHSQVGLLDPLTHQLLLALLTSLRKKHRLEVFDSLTRRFHQKIWSAFWHSIFFLFGGIGANVEPVAYTHFVRTI